MLEATSMEPEDSRVRTDSTTGPLIQAVNALTDHQIRAEELIEAVKILSKKEDVTVSLKYSAASGAIAGVSTVITGLALTPVGLTSLGVCLGAGLGSVTSALLFKKKFKSLVEIIEEMDENERERFVQHFRRGLENISIASTAKFLLLFSQKDMELYVVLKVLMQTYISELLSRNSIVR